MDDSGYLLAKSLIQAARFSQPNDQLIRDFLKAEMASQYQWIRSCDVSKLEYHRGKLDLCEEILALMDADGPPEAIVFEG